MIIITCVLLGCEKCIWAPFWAAFIGNNWEKELDCLLQFFHGPFTITVAHLPHIWALKSWVVKEMFLANPFQYYSVFNFLLLGQIKVSDPSWISSTFSLQAWDRTGSNEHCFFHVWCYSTLFVLFSMMGHESRFHLQEIFTQHIN
jgi:hypothetical protein